MNEHTEYAEQKHRKFYPSQPGFVTGIRQFEQQKSTEPYQQDPFVPVGDEVASYGGIYRGYADDQEEEHEVYVGGEVRHEFYYWYFVVFVTDWQGECYPDRRADYENDEEEHRPPGGPVEGSSPQFLKKGNKYFIFICNLTAVF